MPPAPAGASAAAARASLLELLTPLVQEAGYDLEDVAVSRAGRRNLVRVVVDADGGIDLDAVATVSRVVSETLDAVLDGTGDAAAGRPADPAVAQALAGSYTLEVSSPGIDRPLTEPRHWRRATGRMVRTDAKGKAVDGRIVTVDDSGVTLQVKGREQRVAWDDLGRGRVQVEFTRSPGEE